MKKLLFYFAMLVFIGLKANAQTNVYYPMLDTNAYWSEFFNDYSQPNYYYTYFLRGDTIIDSLTYHKFYTDDSTSAITYIGALREYNKRIYYVERGCSNIYFLYDFNLTVGDSMQISCLQFCDTTSYGYMKVTSIDSVLFLDGKYRKRLNFDASFQLIEEIGCLGGLLYDEYYCCTCMFVTASVCFKHNDTTLYENPSDYGVPCFSIITSNNEINNKEDLINIYPNPATNNLTIDVSAMLNIPATIEITNIEGELIETLATTGNKTNIAVSTLAKGMYFVKVKTEKGVAVKKFIKE